MRETNLYRTQYMAYDWISSDFTVQSQRVLNSRTDLKLRCRLGRLQKNENESRPPLTGEPVSADEGEV